MNRSAPHNAIRDDLLEAALSAGLDAEREFDMNGWPAYENGRIDLLIHKPRIGIEVKVDAAGYDACPDAWLRQMARYRSLLGTAADLWLVSDTFPRWSVGQGFYMKTGMRVTTVNDMKSRLRRLGEEGTPLPHVFKGKAA